MRAGVLARTLKLKETGSRFSLGGGPSDRSSRAQSRFWDGRRPDHV